GGNTNWVNIGTFFHLVLYIQFISWLGTDFMFF
ncbi:MAG: hypothetical protein ACI8X3_000818, partial [Saprospiraceae bacterium]